MRAVGMIQEQCLHSGEPVQAHTLVTHRHWHWRRGWGRRWCPTVPHVLILADLIFIVSVHCGSWH